MSESIIAQNGAGPMPAISTILNPASGPMVNSDTLAEAGLESRMQRVLELILPASSTEEPLEEQKKRNPEQGERENQRQEWNPKRGQRLNILQESFQRKWIDAQRVDLGRQHRRDPRKDHSRCSPHARSRQDPVGDPAEDQRGGGEEKIHERRSAADRENKGDGQH